jgi:hypothetical protein
MIATDHHIEVLAQAMWLGRFGVKQIQPAWVDWTDWNPDRARILREQARQMLGVSLAHVALPTAPRMTNHHSLSWLFT